MSGDKESQANSRNCVPDIIPEFSQETVLQLVRYMVAEMLGLGMICFVAVFYHDAAVPGPIVIGLTFTWVVWVMGPVSGAQVNPVISLMLLFTRRLSLIHVLVSILGQLVGGTAGCFLAKALAPDNVAQLVNLGMTLPSASVGIGKALGLEIIGTSVLVFSVLAVADEIRPQPWSQGHFVAFPFEFGVTLALLASLLGPFTGGSMNPTRSIAAAFLNNNYQDQWLYFVGPFVGMLIATLLYECLLSNGVSGGRLRAWFTARNFDRSKDYSDTE